MTDYAGDIGRLIEEVEATADPRTRDGVRRLVEAILGYHEEAVSRLVDLAGEAAVRGFARDELTASLLLLYGLHPDDFETRVRRAVDRIPGVDLTGISGFVVRLKGNAARETIEQALFTAAPEIAAIEIEGESAAAGTFVPLEALLTR
jgi:hypothetical protein